MGDDRNITRQYGAREAISTSMGQNDSGLLELTFRDERRVPSNSKRR
jgi:Tc toxin complex TcA C-terminal TcB-binding domain